MILHTTLQYIEDITSMKNLDYYDPKAFQQNQAHLQMLDLLYNGVRDIRLPDTDEAVEESENKLVFHLRKKGVLKPKIKQGKEKDPFCIHTTHLPGEEAWRTAQRKHGIIHLTRDDDPSTIFGEYVQHFDTRERINWSFAGPVFDPHHSMVVADPYLFTRYGLYGLKALLNMVAPGQLEEKYHIALVGKPTENYQGNNMMTKAELQSEKDKLTNMLKSKGCKPEIEILYADHRDFHDRYIFTNNAMIFIGYGLGILSRTEGNPFKEGTWLAFRPYRRMNEHGKQGVFITEIAKRKLTTFYEWIQQYKKVNILNPMLQK